MKSAKWFVLFAASSLCAAPHLVQYQGLLTRPDGGPVDTTLTIQVSIYPDSAGGMSVWSETHTSVVVSQGLYHLHLGSLNPIPDIFADSSLWLAVRVGTDTEMTPRIRVAAVPWAYRVGTVDGASGGTIAGDLTVTGKATFGQNHQNTGVWAFVAGYADSATGAYSSVGGGYLNTTPGNYAVVSGGWDNEASTLGAVGGGQYNKAGGLSAIGGGYQNDASGTSAFIGGGEVNKASEYASFVGGGRYNRARGQYSVVVGGGGATFADSNSAGGESSFIGGGRGNLAGGQRSVVCGGSNNRARGDAAFLGGGGGGMLIDSNSANGYAAALVGGITNESSGSYGFLGGGNANRIQSTADWSTLPGGYLNDISSDYSLIGGGAYNDVDAPYALICGGLASSVTGSGGAIVGGRDNFSGVYAFVGGGERNWAQGPNSVICGGDSNDTSLGGAAVLGGRQNTAGGYYSAVGGGRDNSASGDYSFVAGGRNNLASGDYSFAAGYHASADEDGSFVWADASTATTFSGSNPNQFYVRAAGGIRLYTSSDLSTGSRLAAGGSDWIVISDSTKKRNRRNVDTGEILRKVTELPIQQWSYKSQDAHIEHVGPMAQDFWKLFQLGDDSLAISTIDPSGVALAAIQELAKRCERIEQLESEVTDLKRLVQQMMQLGMNENQTRLENPR